MHLKALLVPAVAAITTVTLAAGPAAAGNPHFIKSQTSAHAEGTSLVVDFKEAGLPSGSVQTIQATAHLDAEYSCVNGGGNIPADPKKTTVSSDVSASGVFPAAKNGQLTGTLVITAPAPATALDCPGGQTATLMSAVWSNVRVDDLTNGAWITIPGTF